MSRCDAKNLPLFDTFLGLSEFLAPSTDTKKMSYTGMRESKSLGWVVRLCLRKVVHNIRSYDLPFFIALAVQIYLRTKDDPDISPEKGFNIIFQTGTKEWF